MQVSYPARKRSTRSLLLIYAVATLVIVSALIPLWAEVAFHDGFAPQGDSLNWDRVALWLHLVTDTLIGLAYVAISGTLIYLARKAGRSIPFLWAFVAFGVFIVACGMTHFMAAITLWEPVYWVAGGVKYVTALASVGTAVAVPPLVPKVLGIVNEARVSAERKRQLEVSNRVLAVRTDELVATLAETRRARELLQHELESQQHDLEDLAREVSARRREAEQAMQVREEFLSMAAHELKTPLTTIKATAQLVDRVLESPSPDPRRVSRLRQQHMSQIKRLEELVTDLLDASRIQQGRLQLRPQRFELADLVRSVAERFEHDRYRTERHQLRLDLSEDTEVVWDRERMDQVLTNLVSNALKYSPNGGQIEIVADVDESQIRLSVSDQGIGINPADQPGLFQPFSRTAESRAIAEGTGLGLYITRQIVEQHRGSISVASRPGRGSTFSVTLQTSVDELAPSGNPLRQPGA